MIDEVHEEVVRQTLYAFVSSDSETAMPNLNRMLQLPKEVVVPLMQKIAAGALNMAFDEQRPPPHEVEKLVTAIVAHYQQSTPEPIPDAPIRALLNAAWGYPREGKMPEGEMLFWLVMITAYAIQLGDEEWSDRLDRIEWEIEHLLA